MGYLESKLRLIIQPNKWVSYIFYKIGIEIPWQVAFCNFIFQRILRVNSAYPFSINFTSIVSGKITIGENVEKYFAVSGGCYIQGGNGIEIGDFTIFAPGVKLISANHSIDSLENWDPAPPLRIGKRVWLGANVVVLPGVQIGDDVVVGAGAIVTKDIPAGAIVVGNPARILKFKSAFERKDG